MKFAPDCDITDQAFLKFNEYVVNNQDRHGQIENYETPGAEYPNESDSENTETNKTSALPNFIPKILPDDDIAKSIKSLNSKQREVFNVNHTWAKDNVNMMGMILNQFTYFFQAVESWVNLFW